MTSPQRIGVLTFHRCINYGSYWQARCLVEGLRKRGADAVLLDHHSAAVDRAEWRCALQPLLPVPSPPADRRRYAMKARRFFTAFAGLPLSPRFDLDDPARMGRYDLVVVGSDEVWNLVHTWYGGCPIFYGSDLRADRLAAYAASFGNHRVADGLAPEWAGRLAAFERISVRDANSQALVRDTLGREPALVLDPCLQFPEMIDAGAPADEAEGCIAVYGHSFPLWFQRAVRAAARGRRLVSIGYRNDWADEQRIEAGPEEFARFMAGAAAVATNFFHGCVFALLNRKPFACVPSAYRYNKLRDLTAALGASHHMVSECTPAATYEQLLACPLQSAISAHIAGLRQRSSRYLDDILH